MTQDSPFISVIVPSYNRAALISKTISSLQNQSYLSYEIIVVDDGSTDNTEEVVNALADHRTTYIKKNNAERAAARNFGASRANGEYINFFDSDDIALPNHLEEAVKVILKYQQPEWFHLGFAWADTEDKIFKEVNNFKGDTLNSYLITGNQLSCNGVFVRKDIILKNQFNEDRELSASEDYELWCRLSARYPLYYSTTITSLVIDHEARSVRTINGEKLIKRLKLLLFYLEKDNKLIKSMGSGFKSVKMDAHSYIALHLATEPEYKIRSIQYLFKAFYNSPALVLRKRFYATIKNILFTW